MTAAATYAVAFVDWDATVLKTQTVEHGRAAAAPADPTRSGYKFIGWDKAFNNVTSDLTVTAVYETDNSPEILSVDYSGFTYLVANHKANVPVTVVAKNADGLRIFAGLFVNGVEVESAEVINGAAIIRVSDSEKIILAEAYVAAWFEGGDPDISKAKAPGHTKNHFT